MQNGWVESFNGRLRDECLNTARQIIKEWRIDYNTNRLNTSLKASHGPGSQIARLGPNPEQSLPINGSKSASRSLTMGIREEIERRVAADEEAIAWGIEQAHIIVAAEREKIAAERHDNIAKLKKRHWLHAPLVLIRLNQVRIV